MNWDKDIDLSKLKITSRLIAKRIIQRGWKFSNFETNSSIFIIFIPGREKPVKIFSASPGQMSYPATKISKNKYITNQILNYSGIVVPKEILVNINENNYIEKANGFLSNIGQVVVKPLDASHGKGITVNITTKNSLCKAIDIAKNASLSPYILIQEQISGVDIRVICIGYEFVDSYSRIPAHIIGDGVHTIKEIIEIENKSDRRGTNYSSILNIIPLENAIQFLGKDKLNDVPANHKKVQVVGVSNIGMGGSSQNMKLQIPHFLIKIAEKCAKELDLPVCGVDFMVKRLPQKNDSYDDLLPCVIEVNECPSLAMYKNSDSKEQNAIIDKYLDFISKG